MVIQIGHISSGEETAGALETVRSSSLVCLLIVYIEWSDDELEIAVAIVVFYVPYSGSLNENVLCTFSSVPGVSSKFLGLVFLIGF